LVHRTGLSVIYEAELLLSPWYPNTLVKRNQQKAPVAQNIPWLKV